MFIPRELHLTILHLARRTIGDAITYCPIVNFNATHPPLFLNIAIENLPFSSNKLAVTFSSLLSTLTHTEYNNHYVNNYTTTILEKNYAPTQYLPKAKATRIRHSVKFKTTSMTDERYISGEGSATSPGSGTTSWSTLDSSSPPTPDSGGLPTPQSPTRRVINTGASGNTPQTHVNPQAQNQVPTPQTRQLRDGGQIRTHVQMLRSPPWVQGQPVANHLLERNPLHLHHQQQFRAPPLHQYQQQQVWAPPLPSPRRHRRNRAGAQNVNTSPELHSDNKAKQRKEPASYSDYQQRTRAQPGEQAQREELGARFRERQEVARVEARRARAEQELEDAKGFEDDDKFIPNIKH
ncbi:hypothetical protein F4680DRAFT_444509 [Xylaria scruposa]|nr:hypothetical protein F4680DRAFT_444509 [Xylaria scruposa]